MTVIGYCAGVMRVTLHRTGELTSGVVELLLLLLLPAG